MREVEREGIQGALPDLTRRYVTPGRAIQHVLRPGDDLTGRMGVAPGDGTGRGNGLQTAPTAAGALRAIRDLRVPHLAGHAATRIEGTLKEDRARNAGTDGHDDDIPERRRGAQSELGLPSAPHVVTE